LHAKLTTGDASAPSIDKLQWVENASPEIERMQDATVICAQCPACLPLDTAGDGESVGCLGRINYPVEAQFEKFLADRVQLPSIHSTKTTNHDCFAFSSIRSRRLMVRRRKSCAA
jgi:hypothetical protein